MAWQKKKNKQCHCLLDILGENVMLVEIRLSAEGSAADRADVWALAKMRGRNMLIEQVKMAVSRVALRLRTRVWAQTVMNSLDMLCPVSQKNKVKQTNTFCQQQERTNSGGARRASAHRE